MRMPPTLVENSYSRLLTSEENLQIFKLLGNRCQTICTTVTQLFCTETPYHSEWLKQDAGVLCFVKDNSRKSYFFRLFCLKRNMTVWEQEMYANMEYNEFTLFMHIFEGEDTMVAFNFASTDEAKEFKMRVDDKILIPRRREEKRSKQRSKTPRTQQNIIMKSHTLKEPHDYKRVQDPAKSAKRKQNFMNADIAVPLDFKHISHVGWNSDSGFDIDNDNDNDYKRFQDPAKRKRNITKTDIGVPLGFKHISHVGWNPDSGFDIDSQDEQLKFFFEKAGVSEKQLQDPHTNEFIYDFINKNGGREAIEEWTNRQSASARKTPVAPPVPPVPPKGKPDDYKRVQDPAKRKQNITKTDIGVPLGFKHISHVGWNPDSGFNIDSQDEQLKLFFEKAGVSEKQLQDPHTNEFTYDFINKNGGRGAIEEWTQWTNRHSSSGRLGNIQ